MMIKRFILFLLIFSAAYGGKHFWSQQEKQMEAGRKIGKKYKELFRR